MIDIRQLSLGYPGVSVLEVPRLEIPDGTVTYLLGPNGSGKTTLLRCICGILSPTGGTVRVDGGLVRAHHTTPASLGMHLDYRAVDPRHTARRHLRWIARARGIPADRVAEVLDAVDLDAVADRRLGHFSLGMLQRLGIAAALLSDPRTLILDEPINGLDIEGVLWLRDLLRTQADRGVCVLVTGHLLDEVERNADRIVVLARGEVITDGPLSPMLEGGTRLEDAYLRLISPESSPCASIR